MESFESISLPQSTNDLRRDLNEVSLTLYNKKKSSIWFDTEFADCDVHQSLTIVLASKQCRLILRHQCLSKYPSRDAHCTNSLKVSMTRNCHNQTNHRHREEEAKNDNSDMTIKVKQPSGKISKQEQDTNYCKTKQGPNTKTTQSMGATKTMNKQQQNHRQPKQQPKLLWVWWWA